ncbi:hypothetical protein Drose_21400 [Dactylosporangium roseum]|uniref:Uncharacterized protein n=1 Tax=Dactylosporangium roseum TaxID=47989 RepID=A0ABY5YVQ5_9ACTN|nr:hypothetical protein [Dactylosporangium roseum]UWZ33830.1 hypothetical protein Drose_21400 [Dactylosporangium roseum]
MTAPNRTRRAPTPWFLDDVRAWPSVEPAVDFTATAALALSLTAAGEPAVAPPRVIRPGTG